MNVSPDDFQQRLADLPDLALLQLNRDELPAEEREPYDRELASRGLHVLPLAQGEIPPGDLVTAAIFTYPAEATLARALLEDAGIPCYLGNEHTLSMDWLWTNALGGLKLMVPATYLEQAQAILEAQISDAELTEQAEAAGHVQ